MRVALAHDYLTQRGGAERVVLELLAAFPDAPLYTAVWAPEQTYPEFRQYDIRTSPLNRLSPVRRDHRIGLPLYASVFSRMNVDADVLICSSSGWAHAITNTGRKIIYCHNPARWLYQADQYSRDSPSAVRRSLQMLTPALRAWDRRAAATADQYVVNSSVVADRVRRTYGIEPEIVPPPPAIIPTGPMEPVAGIDPGFALTVGRLHAYKNVDALVAAYAQRPSDRLVVVGSGPHRDRLLAMATPNITFLHGVDDTQLRWLYAHASLVLAASHEDYGLTPLEAASFGKPVAVLRWGGFLDTVVEGVTGVFFDAPEPQAVLRAVDEAQATPWSIEAITEHAELFSSARFLAKIRSLVDVTAQIAA